MQLLIKCCPNRKLAKIPFENDALTKEQIAVVYNISVLSLPYCSILSIIQYKLVYAFCYFVITKLPNLQYKNVKSHFTIKKASSWYLLNNFTHQSVYFSHQISTQNDKTVLFFRKWWPFFVVIFYVLCPIPTLIARRHTDGTGGTNSACMEAAIFITMGFIVSSFALPIVLARAGAVCTYFYLFF